MQFFLDQRGTCRNLGTLRPQITHEKKSEIKSLSQSIQILPSFFFQWIPSNVVAKM
jgi:hypothetical protein